jgi:glycosyltransferase involved in cell wall biosynthesis
VGEVKVNRNIPERLDTIDKKDSLSIKDKVTHSISVIISSYNQNKSLTEILSRLDDSDKNINEVIIADDGSDPSIELDSNDLTKNRNLELYLVTHENKGFRKCKILNEAIKKANSEYILFIDGDCLPHKHFVRDHLSVAEKGFFVQGRRCFIQEIQVQRLLDKKTTIPRLILSRKVNGLLKAIRLPRPKIKRNTSMYGLLGCNLAVWREDLLSVNGFDEDYEGWGREDSDLGARLYNLGLQRKVVYGRALVYHLNHPVNKRDNLQENDRKLNETIKSGKIRCANGIVKE